MEAQRPGFSRAYSHYVLGVLFSVYVFNFIDRQILAMLLEDIKRDLAVSDTAMGFLIGPAFALFYTFAGIPIARWADRSSRRMIIASGLSLWSAMTAASGLARNFTQLALARVGVGIGEAAGTPPAHSLISDYFPPERRGRALSIYSMGVYVGVMLAFVAGGYIREYFEWRTAFLIVGLPGLALAALVRFTVREPARGHSEAGPVDTDTPSIRAVGRFLASRRCFPWLVSGAAFQALGGYAVLGWGPTFLSRVHHMESIEVGLWLGLAAGLGGSLGAYLGGALADRLGAGDPRWYLRIPAIVSVAGVPFVVPFLLADDPRVAIAGFIVFYILAAMHVGPMLWAVQCLVKVRMRALASSILLFLLNLVGLAGGPLLIGTLNDAFAGRWGDESIRYSLLIVEVSVLLAGPFFWLASRALPADLRSRDR